MPTVPSPIAGHPARSDCERVLPGIGQPINTLTSLGITAIGLRLARRNRRDSRPRAARWAGWALAAAGIGSAVYHGPGGRLAPWLHDVTLLAPPLVLAVASEADRRKSSDTHVGTALGSAIAGAAAIRAMSAKSQDGLSAVAALMVVSATWQRVRCEESYHDWTALAAAGVTGAAGIGAHALSRTGGPLCKPDSVLQGHGLWHILAAAATVIAAKGMGMHHESWAHT